MTCRLHGPACRAPWGWDRAHTDSDRPYTDAELAVRSESPHFYAYPDAVAYERGWRLWRAFRRDAQLTAAESAVKFAVLVQVLRERHGLKLPEFGE